MEFGTKSWEECGLNPHLVKVCKDLSLIKPSIIQEKSIPEILAGKGVLGLSATGSGKTAAFALPLLQMCSEDPYGVFCLVITPTRELAVQISEQLTLLGSKTKASVLTIVGGEVDKHQIDGLFAKPQFVVATPGRLAELLRRCEDRVKRSLRLCRNIVYDEADNLLKYPTHGGDFHPDLATIESFCHKDHVKHFFTATMTDDLRKQLPENTTICAASETEIKLPDTLYNYYVMSVNTTHQTQKDTLLTYFLKERFDAENFPSVIIFTNRVADAQTLGYMCKNLGFKTSILTSVDTQNSRRKNLDRFRNRNTRILVATNVAARGLDIGKGVSLVINYDVPLNPEEFVHRVGRAARAGADGTSVTIITRQDKERVLAIEKMIGKELESLHYFPEKAQIYTNEAIRAKQSAITDYEDDDMADKVNTALKRRSKQHAKENIKVEH